MGFMIVLPIPIDILDAAIAENLTYMANGFVEFSRLPVTSVSSIYYLTQEELGLIGELHIRKLINDKSELFIKEPPTPISRDITPEENAYIQSFIVKDESIRAHFEVQDRISQEKKNLHTQRTSHLNGVANGLIQRIRADPFTWPQELHQNVSLTKCIDDFVIHIKSVARMTFWRSEERTHKWVSSPEQHAKTLLLAYLYAKVGNSALIFDEIKVGAGRIDIFIAFLNGENTIIELKMCGHGYSLGYAQEGIEQIHHYMDNKSCKNAYLLIFDARERDFSKDVPSDHDENGKHVFTKIVDVRPKVKPT